MSEFSPYRWEAEKIAPSGVRYRVRLADHVLAGPDGKAEATMFSWSYLGQGGGSRRPVVPEPPAPGCTWACWGPCWHSCPSILTG